MPPNSPLRCRLLYLSFFFSLSPSLSFPPSLSLSPVSVPTAWALAVSLDSESYGEDDGREGGLGDGGRSGGCVRPGAEGRWLKWGGVQSDYAKLCPYVLAWKFHPSPGLPPGLGKCIYCCLSSVLYVVAGGASETVRGVQGSGTGRGGRSRLRFEKKNCPGTATTTRSINSSDARTSRRSGTARAPTEPLYSFLGFRSAKRARK